MNPILIPFKVAKSSIDLINYTNDILADILHHRNPLKDAPPPIKTLAHLGIQMGLPNLLVYSSGVHLDSLNHLLFLICSGLSFKAWWQIYRYTDGATTYGRARYARLYEVKKANLQSSGIIFGHTTESARNFLVTKPENQEGHVMINGPTGKGKTKSVALPTICNWKGSAICIDPKGELAQTTAHLKTHKTYVFNPFSSDCDPYDPIEQIKGPEDAQDLAQSLLPHTGGDGFWNRSAVSIVAAAFLEAKHRRMTLHEACNMFIDFNIETLFAKLNESPYPGVRELVSVADGAEQTVKGMMSEIRSHLGMIAADKNLKRATERSSWSPQTLEEGTTIYLAIPESKLKLNQYRGILNAIINQTISYLCDREEKSDPPILILIDELPRLGHLPQLIDGLATLRSRNVHIMGIIQSIAQLNKHYGQDGTKIIMDNCQYKLVLGASEPSTQEYFSRLAGQKTIEVKSKGVKEESERTNEIGVPLIRPEEFGYEDFQPILFNPKTMPIPLKQAWFHSDPVFSKYRNSAQIKSEEIPFIDIEKTKEKIVQQGN